MVKRSDRCPNVDEKRNPITGETDRRGERSVDGDDISQGIPNFGVQRGITGETGDSSPDSIEYPGV